MMPFTIAGGQFENGASETVESVASQNVGFGPYADIELQHSKRREEPMA